MVDLALSFELQYHNGVFELKRNDYSVTFSGKDGKREGIYHTVEFAWSPEWLAAGANGNIKKQIHHQLQFQCQFFGRQKEKTCFQIHHSPLKNSSDRKSLIASIAFRIKSLKPNPRIASGTLLMEAMAKLHL
ncbi:hypothetical protein ACLH0G_04610 [Aeromonas rivipollensis]|uniref:hypothetical protein n=1 Tax=Aeromonas rivipollensis TaxID=948519 RepID=UPI003CFC79EE